MKDLETGLPEKLSRKEQLKKDKMANVLKDINFWDKRRDDIKTEVLNFLTPFCMDADHKCYIPLRMQEYSDAEKIYYQYLKELEAI